jgi:hypothetical protein
MSTALVPSQPDTAALTSPTAPRSALPAQAAALVEWANSAEAALQLARGLVNTPFCPEGFRGKEYDAAAAILAGAEVGLSPMGSLRSFDVIQGTAAPRAITLRAIVQSYGHEIWVEESTSTRAIVAGRRAGSDRVERSEWTIDRAKGLSLTNKHNWKAQPGAMLVARATSECCRLIAADAILGIAYTAEEVDDQGDEQPQAEAPKRTARRKTSDTAPARRTRATATRTDRPATPPAPEPASGPPLPGEDEPDTEPAAAPEREPEQRQDDNDAPVTRAQLNKLHAQLGDMNISEKADKLTTVGLLAQRQLGSSSELTKLEASSVIDILDRCLASDEPQRALDAVLGQLEENGDSEGDAS